MPAVSYDELEIAFAFVNSTPAIGNAAYVCLDTGAIYWTSEFNSIDEQVPDDLETSDRYLPVPHTKDLDLGRTLALRFIAEELPEQSELVGGIFRHKGAYARFKDLLEPAGLLQKWYDFEAKSTEKALRDWCAEHDIRIIERNGGASA